MSVYVDPLCNFGWKYGPSCHMWADDVGELQMFAARLGLMAYWFQDKNLPHFDLTRRQRERAVALGAIELDRRASVMMWRAMRAEVTHG